MLHPSFLNYHSFSINPIVKISNFNFSSFAENPTSPEQNVHDITVSASGYIAGRVNSRLALPIDLNESVEEVSVINEDANLSNFQSNVLSLVDNEQKVLIIKCHSEKLDLIKNKLPQDSFIIHSFIEADEEEEACEWISGKSGKKFLITDDETVDGYEFDTVIIVVPEDEKDRISSLCQRATARLIVCFHKTENKT